MIDNVLHDINNSNNTYFVVKVFFSEFVPFRKYYIDVEKHVALRLICRVVYILLLEGAICAKKLRRKAHVWTAYCKFTPSVKGGIF